MIFFERLPTNHLVNTKRDYHLSLTAYQWFGLVYSDNDSITSTLLTCTARLLFCEGSAMARVNQTGGNRSGYRSNRSGPVPV